jgi:potassium efflux system protein
MSHGMAATAPFALVAAVVALGIAAHAVLRRIDRRLPLALTRWTTGRAAPHPDPVLRRAVALVVLPLEAALWAAIVWWASGRFAPLRDVRTLVVGALRSGLTMPLFEMNDRGYSVADVLALPALLAGLWVATSTVTRLLQARIARAVGADGVAPGVWGMLVRYGGTLVGGLVILEVWGIDVRALAIVGSVLGVGIGFGLQGLANNFVSGIVIGLERPVKPGDYVRIAGHQGTVAHVGARATEIVTNERVSILVPNSKLLETELVNWSHRDPVCRIAVPVTVAYGSSLRTVRAALLEAAAHHPAVLRDRAPRVELRELGENGLHVELEVWTDRPREQRDLTSDLNYRIDAALRRHGIEVPFPQRDLRLRAPALDALVAAFARRSFTDGELAAARASLAPTTVADAPDRADADTGERVWDERALRDLAARLRGPGGVHVADRRHRLAFFRRCFVGREAVDWLVAHEGLSREDAVAVGQRLVALGVLHHVLDEHPFRDGALFYRFRDDEVGGAAA